VRLAEELVNKLIDMDLMEAAILVLNIDLAIVREKRLETAKDVA